MGIRAATLEQVEEGTTHRHMMQAAIAKTKAKACPVARAHHPAKSAKNLFNFDPPVIASKAIAGLPKQKYQAGRASPHSPGLTSPGICGMLSSMSRSYNENRSDFERMLDVLKDLVRMKPIPHQSEASQEPKKRRAAQKRDATDSKG